MSIASLVAAVFPFCLFMAVIGTARSHDRGIVWSALIAALWGGAAATSLTLAADTLVQTELMPATASTHSPIDTVIVAPAVEEALKGVVFLGFLLAVRLETALQGAIIGAAAGLGFAATENYAAFTQTWAAYGFESWLLGVALRTLLPTVMHMTATATAGAIAGAFSGGLEFDRRLLGPFLGYAVGAVVHMGFNGGQHASSGAGGAPLAGAVSVVVVLLLIGVVRWARRRERNTLRAELERVERARHVDLTTPGRLRQAAARRLALLSLLERRKPSRSGSRQKSEIARLARQLERST